MKKNFLKPPYSSSYLNNGVFRINNGHNIFWGFDETLRKKQIVINTIDLDRKGNADSYIYADVPYPWEINVWKKVLAHVEKNILFSVQGMPEPSLSALRSTYGPQDAIRHWRII